MKRHLLMMIAKELQKANPNLKRKLLIGGAILSTIVVVIVGVGIYLAIQVSSVLWTGVRDLQPQVAQLARGVGTQVTELSQEVQSQVVPLQEQAKALPLTQTLTSPNCVNTLWSLASLEPWFYRPLNQTMESVRAACLASPQKDKNES